MRYLLILTFILVMNVLYAGEIYIQSVEVKCQATEEVELGNRFFMSSFELYKEQNETIQIRYIKQVSQNGRTKKISYTTEGDKFVRNRYINDKKIAIVETDESGRSYETVFKIEELENFLGAKTRQFSATVVTDGNYSLLCSAIEAGAISISDINASVEDIDTMIVGISLYSDISNITVRASDKFWFEFDSNENLSNSTIQEWYRRGDLSSADLSMQKALSGKIKNRLDIYGSVFYLRAGIGPNRDSIIWGKTNKVKIKERQ